MHSPFLIPLAVFALVILVVPITQLVKIRDKEMEVQQRLHRERMQHQCKMKELDLELEGAKHGG